MKIRNSLFRNSLFSLICLSLLVGSAYAGNDPSIKGVLREGITQSMKVFIDRNMIGDTYRIYDAVSGKMANLTFIKLHDGIVKKGDFYVSCADFVDAQGKKYDLDFLVVPDGDTLVTTQAIIHSIDGMKRKYHLES